MSGHFLAAFPRLGTTPFRVTSPPDPAYNCIAWTAGSTGNWWWPLQDAGKTYWPEQAPKLRTIDAFRSAFMTLGYSVCLDESVEPGFEKIAIFADAARLPTHTARQLPAGQWTSKLGQSEDIEHDLRALEGEIYGSVALILKRPL